jgi:SET domain-containing protein
MSSNFPHTGVYTRIAPSKIHGVGVIAILPIPKGKYIFTGDDDELCWINKNLLKGLPKEIKKLYSDFCIKKGNMYGCPKNFNEMTPAWYLNHSSNPNVGCDKDYNFYTLRSIKKEEELTVDYQSYSELNGRQLKL